MNELPGTKFSTCNSGICKDLFLIFKVLKSYMVVWLMTDRYVKDI